MAPEALLDAVFETVREEVDRSKQVHPLDVMTSASLIVEAIYQFVSHLPSGTFTYPSSTP